MSAHPTAEEMAKAAEAACIIVGGEDDRAAYAAGIEAERERMAKHLRERAAILRANGLRIIDGVTSQAEVMLSAQVLGAADALKKEADALESK